jgi:hypothetical protein
MPSRGDPSSSVPARRPGELYGLHGHRVDWLRVMTQFVDVVTRAVRASGRSRLPIEERPAIKLVAVTPIAALRLFPRDGSDLKLDTRPVTSSRDHETLSGE